MSQRSIATFKSSVDYGFIESVDSFNYLPIVSITLSYFI